MRTSNGAVSLQIALHSLVGAILVLHGHQLGGSRSGNQDWYRVWMRVRARDERQGSVTVVARQRMDGPILRLSSAGSSVVRLYGSLWLPGVRALRHTACRSADGSCGGAGGVPAGGYAGESWALQRRTSESELSGRGECRHRRL